MTATMTWVGLDVHARSTHAAAIDRESGELTRARFGTGADPVVEWLSELPQPVQTALLRWVSAGGSLTFWGGPEALPPDSIGIHSHGVHS